MTACEDAYRVLDLNIDASFGQVWTRYQSILAGEDVRSDGRRRTNMPAVHHAFKMILNQQNNGLLFDDEEEDDFEEEEDDDDYYVDVDYPTFGNPYDDADQLREAKFSRPRPRNEGYSTNTDGAAVEACASKLVNEEEAQKNENKKTDAKKKKKKKKKKKSVDNSSAPSVNVNNNCSDTRNENAQTDDDSDGEGLDLNSAFAKASKKAAQEKAAATNGNKAEKRRPTSRATTQRSSGVEPPQALRLQAAEYAMEGNRLAKSGEFLRAVNVFTLATKLDGNDHRFFGNRSFCYERLKQYDKALKDADRAVQIEFAWPKGHFRRGRALLGQLKYAEAEEAFRQVLKLDKNVDECHQELEKIKVFKLMQMGFPRDNARSAVRQYKTEEAALDALLRGGVRQLPEDSSDSEDDTGEPVGTGRPADPKEDPSNVAGLRSLWCGNIMQTVTERDLRELFARHGAVTSVRLLPDRYCAFINFGDKKGASLAMQHLQGLDFHGNKLKIKFPDNPIGDGQPKVVIGKKGPPGAVAAGGPRKLTGPVGDGECFYWRTADCTYGTSCKYKHIPASKGIDRKPWRR